MVNRSVELVSRGVVGRRDILAVCLEVVDFLVVFISEGLGFRFIFG